MEDKITLTIHLMNGETYSVTFQPQRGAEWSRAGKIEKMFSLTVLPIEIDGKLMIFPMCNINYIELSPAPPGVNVIKATE